MTFRKRLVVGIITVSVALFTLPPVLAQAEFVYPEQESLKIVEMDSEINGSIPPELVGMDRFLSLDERGCIEMDVEGALAAGYAERAVYGVKEHLNFMNEQVLAGKMYIDDTFTGYMIFDKPEKSSLPPDFMVRCTTILGVSAYFYSSYIMDSTQTTAKMLWLLQ